MMKKAILSSLATTAVFALLSGCASSVNGMDLSDATVQEKMEGSNPASLPSGHTDGGASVHDPSIIRAEDGTYWIFGSHMAVAQSDDLRHWTGVFSGVSRHNKLFSNLFSEESNAFSWVGKNSEGGYSVWAPDIIYNKAMQKYCMYFCTSSTYVKSSLCLAVSDSVNGPYEYKGRLLDSGFTRLDAKKGKVDIMNYVADETELKTRYLNLSDYNNMKWPNAIDPTVFYDKDGRLWMVYGSWSGGIFLLELNEETGEVIHPARDDADGVDAYFGKHLISGNHQSCEGPWIQYDATTGYYYLFVSYGSLTAEGGYQIRLFRSENPDGPYTDPSGQTLGGSHQEKVGLKMIGNYTFPSLDVTYMAPGHNSALEDEDGKLYLVYHQRFANHGEYHEPRVHQLFRTQNGWLVAAPFETSGETLAENGYTLSDIVGTYYTVDHGIDISADVPKDKSISLQPDGGIYAVTDEAGADRSDSASAATGTQSEEEKTVRKNSVTPLGDRIGGFELVPDSPYLNLTLEDDSYNGIAIRMTDEAGNPVMCFSVCGDNNETFWGVHYLAE